MNNDQQQTNEALQQAFSNFSASVQQPSTQQAAVEQPITDTETTTTETEVENTTTENTQAQSDTPTNQAFARMRADNSAKTKQLESLEAALKKQGYAGIQDFLEKQSNADLQQRAQNQGISPELEKRIQSLEQENARYKQQEQTANLKTEVGNLVQKYNITKPEWDGFIAQLQENNINPLQLNVPLETLYVQYNLESIFNRRLEKEKQVWVQNQQNVQTSAPINTPTGTPPQQSKSNNANWKDLANRFKNR